MGQYTHTTLTVCVCVGGMVTVRTHHLSHVGGIGVLSSATNEVGRGKASSSHCEGEDGRKHLEGELGVVMRGK